MVNLYAIKVNQKELRFFSLNELPNNLPPVIEKIITDYLKNKGTLNVPSQIQSVF